LRFGREPNPISAPVTGAKTVPLRDKPAAAAQWIPAFIGTTKVIHIRVAAPRLADLEGAFMALMDKIAFGGAPHRSLKAIDMCAMVQVAQRTKAVGSASCGLPRTPSTHVFCFDPVVVPTCASVPTYSGGSAGTVGAKRAMGARGIACQRRCSRQRLHCALPYGSLAQKNLNHRWATGHREKSNHASSNSS
jgi:hypothetical protein